MTNRGVQVLVLVFFVLFGLAHVHMALAQITIITVTTAVDESDNPWADCPPPGNNDCSLREAITVANWNGSSDTIVFDSGLDGQTILLDTNLGPLWVGNEANTVIDATGLATGITINANGLPIALSLNSAALTVQGPITITGAGAGGAALVLNPGVDNATIRGITIQNNSGMGILINGVNTFNGNVVSNCRIEGNQAEGIAIRDSNFVIVEYSTIQNNGGNGISPGIMIVGNSPDVLIYSSTIQNNGGNGITVQEDFASPGNAPSNVIISSNTISNNGFGAVDGVGIQIAGAVRTGMPSVCIGENEISNNAAQGVLVERAGSSVAGPQNVDVGCILDGGGGNYIYDNGQEGVLIKDQGTSNNIVENNYIGVDPSNNPAPNRNSGVALVGGTTNNIVQNNTIRYNQFQEVLISDTGTSGNIVQYNSIIGGADVSPRQGFDNSGVVIINGATNNTVGPGNTITYHVFDGVQVVGPGTDSNQIIDNTQANGGIISNNGRGIAVIHDFTDPTPPDPDAPPHDLQTDSFLTPGPANTTIQNNEIVNNNNDGILIRRDGGGTIIQNNAIQNNNPSGTAGNGIRLVGSSPTIIGNTIEDNAENGILALVFFGTDDNPITANDDVLSQPTIQNNTIGGNGNVGIYAIDTPLGDLQGLNSANSWSSPDGLRRIQQDWYGYVRVTDSGSNPVTGLTIVIEQQGGGGTYISAVDDGNGNYGPIGFTLNSERTYFLIEEQRVTNTGGLVPFTPQKVYVQGDPSNFVQYAYNGQFPDPAGEPGGAIESPSGSGVDRYQFALLQLQPEADLSITKQDSPDPVTVGQNLTYTLEVSNAGPSAASNVQVVDTLPSGVTFVSAVPSQGTCSQAGGVVTCSLGTVNAGQSVTITIVVQPTTAGTLNNSATVSSTTLDPTPGNNSAQVTTQVEEAPPVGGDPPIWGSIVAFPTPELHFGLGPDRDLNRDSDANDCLLRYKDMSTGRTISTQLIVSCEPGDIDLYEQTIVFVDGQGHMGIYELDTQRAQTTQIVGRRPSIWGSYVAFESPTGQIALWDLETGQIAQLTMGREPALWGTLLAFQGPEGTIQIYDLKKQQLVDSGAVGREPAVYEQLVAFTAPSPDGEVIRYFDVASGQLHDTGAVGTHPAVWGRYIVFQSQERLAHKDLNGDGDRLDTVICFFDLETQEVYSTGIVGYEPDLYEEMAAFWSYEPALRQDLNGDGDLHDPVVLTYRLGAERAARVGQVELRVSYRRSGVEVQVQVEGLGQVHAQLQVYDLSGRQVYEKQGAPLTWEFLDRHGQRVANGVYLGVITVRDPLTGQQVRRLVKFVVLR